MTASGTGPIRVLIADDDPLVRVGLTMLFTSAGDIQIVAEAGDGGEVPDLVAEHAPDVVLMDIRMPVVDGLTATETLRALPDAPEILVLTTFDADEQVVRALRAGASGFLLKDTPPAEIVGAVRAIAHGGQPLSPTVLRRLIERATVPAQEKRRTVARERLAVLNERERQVAVAIAEGRSNAEIGRLLYLGLPTVKAHVSGALAKLGLNNRVQIALLVHDADLLDERE